MFFHRCNGFKPTRRRSILRSRDVAAPAGTLANKYKLAWEILCYSTWNFFGRMRAAAARSPLPTRALVMGQILLSPNDNVIQWKYFVEKTLSYLIINEILTSTLNWLHGRSLGIVNTYNRSL